MSSLPSAEASANSSSTALHAPRFQFLRNLTHMIGEFIFLASEQTAKPQLAAGGSSPAAGSVNVEFSRPQEPATDPSPTTSPVASKRLATAPDSRSIKIPYIRRTVYIFPDACNGISQAHQDRYPALKDIFQRNIEDNPKLSGVTRYISYELRLCGPCLADATPSIVVFCPLKKLKKLKSLLTQPHIRSQFEPETATPDSVHFGLFFWAQPIDMLAFHKVTVAIPEEQYMASASSIASGSIIGRAPWGVHITDSDEGHQCTATMSCMIQIEHRRFGLTTAHNFGRPWATSLGTDNTDSDYSDTEDEGYDMVTERDDHRRATMELLPALPLTPHRKEVRLDKSQVYIPPHEDTSAWVQEHANLDWALVDLGLEDLGFNNFIPPTLTTAAGELIVANHLPQQCLDVLIRTRAHLDVPATLYNIPSYIGGVKGSQAAEVWTVGCAPGSIPIRKGDSGSIVVGAQSGELYGMVVAANPFGDVHIVPFTAILAQVKEWFETQSVFLLNLPPYFSPPAAAEPELLSTRRMLREHTMLGSGSVPDQRYQSPPLTIGQRSRERRQEIANLLKSFDQRPTGQTTSQAGPRAVESKELQDRKGLS